MEVGLVSDEESDEESPTGRMARRPALSQWLRRWNRPRPHKDLQPADEASVMRVSESVRNDQDLARALRANFSGQGRSVHVLPWVQGTRGMLGAGGIRNAKAFTGIPASRQEKDHSRTTASGVVGGLSAHA